MLLLKITGAVASFLVEPDPKKRKKDLRQENGKWATHATCDGTVHRTTNEELLSHKNISKEF